MIEYIEAQYKDTKILDSNQLGKARGRKDS